MWTPALNPSHGSTTGGGTWAGRFRTPISWGVQSVTSAHGLPRPALASLSRQPHWNCRSPALRAAFQEPSLSTANLVYPLFIHEGEEDTAIGAMPRCCRLGWRHGLVEEVSKARDVGVNNIMLFPKVPDVIYTDVALGFYSSNGHDGIIREDGKTTLSLMHAERVIHVLIF
ncbi:Delta-aminolevulinic acid dehydratase 1 [Abeliophyllum distichum]|uniref:porphobilinogen synthase n=1 Tax=Abeliophyllum distichum TaxID=126358 RepID=A0ABD1SS94_9LAMI